VLVLLLRSVDARGALMEGGCSPAALHPVNRVGVVRTETLVGVV
jgi:hypothetical protein